MHFFSWTHNSCKKHIMKGPYLLVSLIWLAYVVHLNYSFLSENSSTSPDWKGHGRCSSSFSAVQLNINDQLVVIDNGLVQVTLSKAHGFVTRVKYNGIDNVLETHNSAKNRGYWDVVWHQPGVSPGYDRLQDTNFSVVVVNEHQVEVSFSKTWDPSKQNSSVPLNVDKRYIVRRGSSGFYMYSIMERFPGWPTVNMDQFRIVFKLDNHKFHHLAVSDDLQKIMPTPRDFEDSEELAFPEARLLINPSNPQLRGQVDDKYQYSMENKNGLLKGWISNDPMVGFWLITPSTEFCAGGPIKQDLTGHVGPTLLSMFTSTHYVGMDLNTEYQNGQPWKKVFGPIFVYLNSNSSTTDYRSLWNDAKRQLSEEVRSWPYKFPQSEDFPSSDRRGSVAGRLLVHENHIGKNLRSASFAYVGLAAPGDAGSWQRESQGYQFWTRAIKNGGFLIKNVRPGDYNLYAWVPGVVGDYKYELNITVEPGSRIQLGYLKYDPPRTGPTLWEIGIPDRSAAEFFVPDPYPSLVNKLSTNEEENKFRQYGLWERYTDLYPLQDLTFDVGVSTYGRDWFFAQVPRKTANNKYVPTTWQIRFELQNVQQSGNYTLQLALASAHAASIQIRFNQRNTATKPHFTIYRVGKDNAIARHGIHGLYHFYSIEVPSDRLMQGNNTIYLTQPRVAGPFYGVMYDYIRLEGPS